MKSTFSLVIALPGMALQTFEAKSLSFPGKNGYLGVMAGRQPLLANIEAGVMKIVDVEDKEYFFGITGGFCEMIDNHATLLCDSLILPSEIDLEEQDEEKSVFNRPTENMTEHEKRQYVCEHLRQRLKKNAKNSTIHKTNKKTGSKDEHN